LNADGYLNANGDIIGYNMFAYCSNNPVMYVDPSGQNIVEWFKQKKQAMADGVKALTIKAVMFYLNPNEQAVLEAEWFAFYKGAPVLKVPFMGDNAFSCGTIFMGKDEGLKPVDVRHEYGHYLQLKEIGMPKYLKFVAIPSLVDYWGGTSREDYYSQPQEYIADIYGKANRTDYKYKEDAGVRANAYWDYVKKPFVFDIYDYIPIHTSSDLFAYFPQ